MFFFWNFFFQIPLSRKNFKRPRNRNKVSPLLNIQMTNSSFFKFLESLKSFKCICNAHIWTYFEVISLIEKIWTWASKLKLIWLHRAISNALESAWLHNYEVRSVYNLVNLCRLMLANNKMLYLWIISYDYIEQAKSKWSAKSITKLFYIIFKSIIVNIINWGFSTKLIKSIVIVITYFIYVFGANSQ